MMIAAGVEARLGQRAASTSLGASPQQCGEGAAERREPEVDDEDERGHHQEQAEAILGDVEPGEHGRLSRAALLLDRRAHLDEEFGELAVDPRSIVEDETREDESAGVDGGDREEDGEAAEQAEAGSEASAKVHGTDLRVVDTEDHYGGSDGPEPREQHDGWKGE